MLQVLIEQKHLHDVNAARTLGWKLPVEQYDDLLKGKLHESAVAVLWADFGNKYALKDDDLTEMIVSLLTELYLISPARLSEASSDRLFDCSLLKPSFDFKRSWNESVDLTNGDTCSSGEWYALDFLFVVSRVETRGNLIVCEESMCPEGLCERFVTLLHSRESEWRDFLRYGSYLPLRIFKNCLTDGQTCMVAPTDEAIRVLLRVKDAGARVSVLYAAKTIRDLFLKMIKEFYESCVFFNEIVPRAVRVFEFDHAGGVVLPTVEAEPVGGRFRLASIELGGGDYVKPHDEEVVWVKALDNLTLCDVTMLWPMEHHDARRQVEQSKERRNFVIVAKCMLEHMRVICRSLFRVQFISVMKRLQRVSQNSKVLSDESLQDMSRWRTILDEDLVVDSFSFEVVRGASNQSNIVLGVKRNSLRVENGLVGSTILSQIENFHGAQQCGSNQWEFRNTFVAVRLCSEGGAEVGEWSGAVGVKCVEVSRRPGCTFKHFDVKFTEPIDGDGSEVQELRVECRLPRVRFDKNNNRESIFWHEADRCDVTVLYKLLLDPACNFCESQMTIIGGLMDSVEGVFDVVRAVRASRQSLNLYECMDVLRILRNRVFAHTQFRIEDADYAKARAVLEYLADTIEAYMGDLLLDESKSYFRGSGAFSGMFQEENDDVKGAARRIRASLANNVAPDAALESSLDGSEDDFDSAMQRDFTPADYSTLCAAGRPVDGARNIMQHEGHHTVPAALPEYTLTLRQELHMTEALSRPGEVIEQAVAWITDGDSTVQCNAVKDLLKKAQYLVCEALPVFQHRITALRDQITLSAEEPSSPAAVVEYAIGELLGDDHCDEVLCASEQCLLRKVNYLLTEVLGLEI